MSSRSRLILLSGVLLTGCEHTERVATGTWELTQTPIVVRFDTPVTAAGPTRELCLVGSLGNVSTIAPGGPDVVHAVLLTSGGTRDTMDTRNVERRSDEMVCVWDHGLEGRRPATDLAYTGVELSSSHDVRAREVRWWSGQRRKWLF
jgi:hypothetical protein